MQKWVSRMKTAAMAAAVALTVAVGPHAAAAWPAGASLADPLAEQASAGMPDDVIRTRGFRLRMRSRGHSRGGISPRHVSSTTGARSAGSAGGWRPLHGKVVRVIDLPDVPGLHWRGGRYKDLGYLFAGDHGGWVAYIGEGRYLPITSRELRAMLRLVGMSGPPPVPARPAHMRTMTGHKDRSRDSQKPERDVPAVEAAAPADAAPTAPAPRIDDDVDERPFREMQLHDMPAPATAGRDHRAAIPLRGSLSADRVAPARGAMDMITTGTVAPVSASMRDASLVSGGGLVFLLLGLVVAALSPFVARRFFADTHRKARTGELLARLSATRVGNGGGRSASAATHVTSRSGSHGVGRPAFGRRSVADPMARFGQRPAATGPQSGTLAAARFAYARS